MAVAAVSSVDGTMRLDHMLGSECVSAVIESTCCCSWRSRSRRACSIASGCGNVRAEAGSKRRERMRRRQQLRESASYRTDDRDTWLAAGNRLPEHWIEADQHEHRCQKVRVKQYDALPELLQDGETRRVGRRAQRPHAGSRSRFGAHAQRAPEVLVAIM